MKASKNKSYSIPQRKQFLLKSYQNIKADSTDSLKARRLASNAYHNLKLSDTILFKRRNAEAMALATTLKDSFAMGDVHWNYATFYVNKEIYDSAYHHFNDAFSYFDKRGHLFESAKTQYGMAFIKGRFKDYSGSEVLTIKAIEKFKKIEDFHSLFS